MRAQCVFDEPLNAARPPELPPKKKGKADALPLVVRFYRCTGARL
jgi:hypothetical protein